MKMIFFLFSTLLLITCNKQTGVEFHVWVPAMIRSQHYLPDHSPYTINDNGEPGWEKPAYVDYQ